MADAKRVEVALGAVLKENGHSITGDPRRLKGLLTDELGVDYTANRALVDAVVSVTETENLDGEAVTTEIEEAGTSDTWIAFLLDNGVAQEIAESAIAVWQTVLSTPISLLGRPTELTEDARLTELTDASTGIPEGTNKSFASRVTDRFAGVPAWLTERKAFVAAAPLALLLIVVVSMSLNAGGGDVEIAADTTTTSTSTVMSTSTTTSLPPSAVLSFNDEFGDDSVFEVTRTWDLEGDRLSVILDVKAPDDPEAAAGASGSMTLGDGLLVAAGWPTIGFFAAEDAADGEDVEEIEGSVFDVFPTPLEVLEDLVITNEDTFSQLARSNQAVRFSLSLRPGETYQIEYSVPFDVGSLSDHEALERRYEEWLVAVEEFLDSPPPDLTVHSPEDGSTVSDAVILVAGETSFMNQLRVGSKVVDVDVDGTWEYEIELEEGDNEIVVTVRDLLTEKRTTITLTIAYGPAIVEESSTGSGSSGSSGGGSGGSGGSSSGGGSGGSGSPSSTTSTTTTTTTTTLPPKPTVTLSGPTNINACYRVEQFTVQVSNATSGIWRTNNGWSEPATSTGLSNVYGDHHETYTAWVEYEAIGPGGSTTARHTITVQPDDRVTHVRPYDECKAVAAG